MFANPGQSLLLPVQTTDGYTGERTDGYVPRVTSVFNPSLTELMSTPVDMTRIGLGQYVFAFNLPSGVTSIGTYIVSALYVEPGTGKEVWNMFTINVALPFGNSSVSPL